MDIQEENLMKLSEILDDEHYTLYKADISNVPMSYSQNVVYLTFKPKLACTPIEILESTKFKDKIINLIEDREIQQFGYNESSDQYNILVPHAIGPYEYNGAYDDNREKFNCLTIPYIIQIKFIIDNYDSFY